MRVTNDEIRHVAKLAMLSFSESEVTKLATEMGGIIDMAEKLNEQDLSDFGETLPEKRNALRADELGLSLTRDEVLQNAPEKKMGCILVPKIVE